MTTEANLADIHKKSRHNRSLLAKSMICGCFYCCNEFPFAQIAKWTDDDATAICPYCGIDAVLGFDFPVADRALLREMHDRWFNTARPLTADEWTKAVERNAWPPRLVRPRGRK
jgi:hypothetical protein